MKKGEECCRHTPSVPRGTFLKNRTGAAARGGSQNCPISN
jgi:hypothetical protein